jgi:hypothetical protein
LKETKITTHDASAAFSQNLHSVFMIDLASAIGRATTLKV